MAEERDFINWAKLVEYPVYNASMMKPCSDFESSILGIHGGTVITPDSAYEDTVREKEAFVVRVFSRRYTENGKDAAVTVRMEKEEFTRIMCECVKTKPKKYVWEHPDFAVVFNDCIIRLSDRMNKLNLGDLFVRAEKPYILGKGNGFIYADDIVCGAFCGLILSARHNGSDGVAVRVTIPRMIHNPSMGSLANSTFVYVDKESNLRISFNGGNLVKDGEGHTIESKRSSQTITITRFDTSSNVFNVPEDVHSEMMSKKLRVPMSKFDFRMGGVLPTLGVVAQIKTHVPVQSVTNRLAHIRR